MRYSRHVMETEEGPVTGHYFDGFGIRILIAVATGVWYTKGVTRKVPFYVNRKGLFVGRIAIRVGKLPSGGATQ